jgi:hypothetical protein
MKRWLVLGAALVVAAGFGSWAIASLPLFSPPKEITQLGDHAVRLHRVRHAEGAGVHGAVRPGVLARGSDGERRRGGGRRGHAGPAVPNDYYIRNPDHKLLTYKLPANAHVTVLKNLQTTKVKVARLASLLKTAKGCSPYLLKRPCLLGFWLRYSIDTVKALDQQYQP